MRIEMDTFHPAATRVCFTHREVVRLAANMRDEDVNIVLGYEAMDYEKLYAEYGSEGKRRRIEL